VEPALPGVGALLAARNRHMKSDRVSAHAASFRCWILDGMPMIVSPLASFHAPRPRRHESDDRCTRIQPPAFTDHRPPRRRCCRGRRMIGLPTNPVWIFAPRCALCAKARRCRGWLPLTRPSITLATHRVGADKRCAGAPGYHPFSRINLRRTCCADRRRAHLSCPTEVIHEDPMPTDRALAARCVWRPRDE
jgi:hypothetical protein